MADPSRAEMVLGGVFPNRADRMKYLARSIRPEHFPAELRRVYEFILRYFTVTGGVVGPPEFREALVKAGVEPAAREAYERHFGAAWKMAEVDDSKWRWAVYGMREDRQRDLMIESLAESLKCLTEGVSGLRGQRMYGYADARRLLSQRLGEIDQLNSQMLPSGNIMEEAKEVAQDYARRKKEGIHYGVTTGFETLDRITFGAQRGELWLVAAYAGEGKTQTLTNMAYHAVLDGKNVVFITLETLRDQVRRRFYVRHGSNPKFESLGEAPTYTETKAGSLTSDQEAVLKAAVMDLADWRNTGYGRLEVDWLPRGSSPADVKLKTDIYGSMFDVDLVVVDYIGLMGAGMRTDRRQEQLVEILQGMKGLATAHNSGEGVPLITAYQISRAGRDEARATGGYKLDHMAETSEAERSADLIWTILKENDDSREVKAQLLKYRDGRTVQEWYIDIDYARSLMTDRTEAGSGGEDEDMGGLL